MEAKHWMGIFIIFVMVFSIFGFVLDFAVSPASETLKYGDFKFRLVNGQYFAKVDGVERAFVFFPADLEFIELSDDVKSLLDSPVWSVSYDPNSSIAENLGEAQYYLEVQLQGKVAVDRGVTSEGSSLPVRSCADATEAQPVVLLQLGDVSSLSVENNCLVVTGLDAYDVYQFTERIVYHILGVMS